MNGSAICVAAGVMLMMVGFLGFGFGVQGMIDACHKSEGRESWWKVAIALLLGLSGIIGGTNLVWLKPC